MLSGYPVGSKGNLKLYGHKAMGKGKINEMTRKGHSSDSDRWMLYLEAAVESVFSESGFMNAC